MSTKDALIKNCTGTVANNTGYVAADPLNGIFEVNELSLPPEITLSRISADGNYAYGITGPDSTSTLRHLEPGVAHIVYTTDGWSTYDWFKMPSTDYYEQMVLSPDGSIAAAVVIVKTRSGLIDYINYKHLKIFKRSTVSGKYTWAETNSVLLGVEHYYTNIFGFPVWRSKWPNIFNMVINGPASGEYTLEYLFSIPMPPDGTTIHELVMDKATKKINATTGAVTAEIITASSTLHPRVTPTGTWNGEWPYHIDYDFIKVRGTFGGVNTTNKRTLKYYGSNLTHAGETLAFGWFSGSSDGYGASEILFANILSPTKLFAISVDANVNYSRHRHWGRLGSLLLRGATEWNREITFAGYDGHFGIADASAMPPVATCLVSSNTSAYNYQCSYTGGFFDYYNNPYYVFNKDTTQRVDLNCSYYNVRYGIVKIDSTIY